MVVSLVSIKGTECRVVELGQVASQTGGQVCVYVCVRACGYVCVSLMGEGFWVPTPSLLDIISPAGY